jgi:hypothetical protein
VGVLVKLFAQCGGFACRVVARRHVDVSEKMMRQLPGRPKAGVREAHEVRRGADILS